MITKENIREFLSALGFRQDGNMYLKFYEGISQPLKVDIQKEHFHYEEIDITVGRKTTSNFSEPENFVVFDCVDRLLSMGYKPHHIELEPAWKLGHTQKGGYADIWVRTTNSLIGEEGKESLLIIECKRPDEFDGAWKDTLEDGAQLFSYFQQEQATQFLCLYTSDLENNKTKPKYYLINVKDNDETLKNDPKLLPYKEAKNNKQLYRVWHDTYQSDATTRGLFESDVQPYHIGKNKFTVNDLAPISNDEIRKKYNEFATILRRHNVGAKENAFDKLVNLFLAKVVDETNNPDNLQFYWKGASYDDDFSLQDRLQRLYRDGMEKFLNETVTYIENEQIEKAFRWYKKDPDATMKTVLEYFRALKFYSDNDFSFISVHNERLFKENAIILKEVLLMLQNIKLKATSEKGRNSETNQFLGDLFEGFLTKGVKQSEGQYFTPMPIVRFIVSSLPLEEIISKSDRIPNCIDYACGAGHFLTEYAVRIKEFIQKYRPDADIHEYYKHIVGIEKEYRLSKVSKVSAFMYGHDETNIIYADALRPNKALCPDSYDVLIANPPYAVTGFLETLNDMDRTEYSLYNSGINTSKNNAIETFFMERSAQLMRSGGVAGIVLPVSILNKGGIFVHAREIILESFDIIAISEFGGGTFGKTSTSTVVLFLRRKETNTPAAQHYRSRIKSWFTSGDNAEDIYQDEHLLKAYCDQCGYEFEDYRLFLSDRIVNDALKGTEIFKNYFQSFDSTERSAMTGVCEEAKDIRNRFRSRSKTQSYRKLNDSLKKIEKEKFLSEFIASIEQEKIYIFLLTFTVNTQVLIVKSPTKTAEIKKFLGYGWSDSKGNEGIEYLHLSKKKSENDDESDDDDTVQQIRGINGIRTPLFNPDNLYDHEKINTLIRLNFIGEDIVIPDDLSEFVSQVRLVDMIDFKRTAFDKAIKTVCDIKTSFKEFSERLNYEQIKIVAPIVSERISSSEILNSEYITTDNMLQNFGGITYYTGNQIPDRVIRYKRGDILMSNIRPYLKKIWVADREGGCSPDVLVFRPTNKVLPSFVGYILQRQKFVDFTMSDIKGLKMPRGNKSNIERYLIPVPSHNIQEKIVHECKDIDIEVEKAKKQISKANEEIDKILSEVNGELKQLNVIAPFTSSKINFDDIPSDSFITTDNMLQNFEGVSRYNGEPQTGKVTEYQIGDILMSNIRPYLKKIWLADRKGGCNPDIMVFRPSSEVIPKFVYHMLCRQEFIDFVMSDVKGMKMPRGNKDNIIRYSIPVPSLEAQQCIVTKILEQEKTISIAKSVINSSAGRKQAVLNKYLK